MNTITIPVKALTVGRVLVQNDRRLRVTSVVIGAVVRVLVEDKAAHSFFFPITANVEVEA